MKILLVLVLLFLSLYAKRFSVASYNVENLFDAKKSGYEFEQYIPYGKSGWSKKMYAIKIKNIARVIKDIDADIISLQEIENKEVLKRLNLALGEKRYPYMYGVFKSRPFDVVLLSRYPIKEYSSYTILKRFRPIHRVVVDIEGLYVSIFINHWPSRRHPYETRMKFAEKLKKLYEKEDNYILLGDFNSPFKKDKSGWGREVGLVSKTNYNLWFDTPYKERYSYRFFRLRSAIDHIIVSKSMFERYKRGSFEVHKFDYLVAKYGNAKRWEIGKKSKGRHVGTGYSNHFALSAVFTADKQRVKLPKKISIKELIKKEVGRVNYLLRDVMVIDKNRHGVTIEDKNRDTIFIYKPDFRLEVGEIYSLHVRELGEFRGKRQIVLLDFNSPLDSIADLKHFCKKGHKVSKVKTK